MNNKIRLALLTPLIVIPSLVSCNKNKVDFNLLKNNFKTMLKNTTSIKYFKDLSKSQIRDKFDSVTISGIETFKFKDIDYDKIYSRSSYDPRNHLDRALELAIIADNNNDAELKDWVRKLEYYWVFNNYRSPNWYENEIGTIRSLTNVGMFEFDDLNDKGKDAFKGKIRNASIYYHPGLELHQGANLMDYAQNTFKSGILSKDNKETDCAFNRLMEEIVEDGKEGFQSEGTYFQHGKLISTGSYGNVATSKIGDFMTALKGSSYKVPQAKLKIIMNCILVGLKYMIQREYKNWMCEGRSFCDEDPYKYNTSSIKRYLDFEDVSNEDKENLKQFINNHDEGKVCFTDTKVFPKARTIISNIDGVYMAFKGCDPTTVNTECLNNENELAYNFSYGMNTCVMQSGKEYLNLSPVCNFSFLPGGVSKDYGSKEDGSFTTEGDTALFNHIKELGNERFEDKVASTRDDGTPYVYGMADELSSNGVACMFQQGKHSNKTYGDKTFKGQTFTVACFATNEGIAILGSGMCDLDSDVSTPRYVTLDQCVLNEGDTVEEYGASIKHSYKNSNKGVDTSVYYRPLTGPSITLKTPTVTGNFQRNHSVATSKEITQKTMIAYLPIDTTNNNSYAYTIQTKSKIDLFSLVTNTEDVQAVRLPNYKIAACFYNKDPEKQTFKYNSGRGEQEYKLTNQFIEGQGGFQVFDIK